MSNEKTSSDRIHDLSHDVLDALVCANSQYENSICDPPVSLFEIQGVDEK